MESFGLEQLGMNGGMHWRWTAKDIVKIREYKKRHYREGQGRRSKKRSKNQVTKRDALVLLTPNAPLTKVARLR